jgi:hypothetical protein
VSSGIMEYIMMSICLTLACAGWLLFIVFTFVGNMLSKFLRSSRVGSDRFREMLEALA